MDIHHFITQKNYYMFHIFIRNSVSAKKTFIPGGLSTGGKELGTDAG